MAPARQAGFEAEPWSRVADRLVEGERQIDRCAGWVIGESDDVPCTVYLTDRQLLLSMRAWLLTNPARLVATPLHTVRRCGTRRVDRQWTRLAYVADPRNSRDPETVEGFSIDLGGGRRGRRFGDLVARTVDEARPPETLLQRVDAKPIDWDDVRLSWAKKLAVLEKRPPLALPYGSVSAMVILGEAGGSDRRQIIEWLARTHPDELPLDMAPAKCRAVDEQFFEKARALGLLNMSLPQMEAQLLATDEAVYYITPGVDDLQIRWPWAETTIRAEDRGTFATAVLTTAGTRYDIELGARAAANMAAIADWAALGQ